MARPPLVPLPGPDGQPIAWASPGPDGQPLPLLAQALASALAIEAAQQAHRQATRQALAEGRPRPPQSTAWAISDRH